MSSLIMPTDESASQYTLFGNDDKEAVVSFIKDFIEPTGKINNGYINTRYACREKFKGKKRFRMMNMQILSMNRFLQNL